MITCVEKPTCLKGIIVYDAPHSSLRSYYKADSVRIQKTLFGIAANIGLTPKLQVIKINNFSYRDVKGWVKKLTPNDVAFFYYAGQPLYSPNEHSRWPSFNFSRGKSHTFLAQDLLSSMIKEKAPFLGVVLFDCYNKIVTIPKKHFAISRPAPIKGNRKDISLKWLFTKTSGVVSACSMRRNEDGLALRQDRPVGGVFTTALLGALEHVFGDARWSEILYDLKEDCLDISVGKQHIMCYENLIKPKRESVVRKCRSENIG